MSLPSLAHDRRPAHVYRNGAWSQSTRDVVCETALAIVVDGGAAAVMMASPADLEDFAYGFALSEGLVESSNDIRDLDIAQGEIGIELRLWLQDGARSTHAARRRRRAGPVGCGLCGVESLEEAMRPISRIDSHFTISAAEIIAAMRELPDRQTINRATSAAHAVALYSPEQGITLVREDVGRHNALDKLIGALTRQGKNASGGVILATSRLSIELIQKAAHIGAPVLAAISAPSTLALDAAQSCGLCVCGIVRDNGLEVFTCAERIT
jgi:FdhD protein